MSRFAPVVTLTNDNQFAGFRIVATCEKIHAAAELLFVIQVRQPITMRLLLTQEETVEDGRHRGERLQIMLTPEELTAVDDFRYQTRMPSRAAAVRELLKVGLEKVRGNASPGMKSADYGVLRRTTKNEPTPEA